MPTLLSIKASPRGSRSRAITVADAFIAAYSQRENVKLVRRDLSSLNMTPFDESAVNAKYAVMHGTEMEIDEHAAWLGITDWTTEFSRADVYAFAVPMWNFGIPYTLKHYFDLVIQPGLTFKYDPATGYEGLLKGKKAFVALARGGEYAAGPAAGMDFQKPHIETMLRFMGVSDIHTVVIEPTILGTKELIEERLAKAVEAATAIAAKF